MIHYSLPVANRLTAMLPPKNSSSSSSSSWSCWRRRITINLVGRGTRHNCCDRRCPAERGDRPTAASARLPVPAARTLAVRRRPVLRQRSNWRHASQRAAREYTATINRTLRISLPPYRLIFDVHALALFTTLFTFRLIPWFALTAHFTTFSCFTVIIIIIIIIIIMSFFAQNRNKTIETQ